MTRTQYTPEQKLRVAREAVETGSITMVSRRHEIAKSVIARWVKLYREHGEKAFTRASGAHIPEQNPIDAELQRENETLKKLLGEKDLEIAILRDLVKKTRLR